MKKIIILCLFLLSNHVYATDIEWFENEWISDRDATVLANPQYMTGEAGTWIVLKSETGFCGGVITSWKGAKSIVESMD